MSVESNPIIQKPHLSIEPVPALMSEYLHSLNANGTLALPGSANTIWMKHEAISVVRYPVSRIVPLEQGEAARVFRSGRAAVVSYTAEPDGQKPANSMIYICLRGEYQFEALSKNARRDARLALRSFSFDFVPVSTLREKGYQAFQDTRTRVGLSDGTWDNFQRRCDYMTHPGHYVLGAWKGDDLAAFVTMMVIGDTVEIEGSFSHHQYSNLCPNDGLIYTLLDHFFSRQEVDVVSYGLSSIQPGHETSGLDRFKRKVGFQPIPVHRVFQFHPLIQPFLNRWSLAVLHKALSVRPDSRVLGKMVGVIEVYLEKTST